jgi:NADH dehydrogenase
MVRSHTDLPIDGRGTLVVRADLRVGTDSEAVPDAEKNGHQPAPATSRSGC